MWYELGLELLEDNSVAVLENIKCTHPNSCENCCMQMFMFWRNSTPEGSWKKLLDALKHIQQNLLVEQLLDRLQYTGE